MVEQQTRRLSAFSKFGNRVKAGGTTYEYGFDGERGRWIDTTTGKFVSKEDISNDKVWSKLDKVASREVFTNIIKFYRKARNWSKLNSDTAVYLAAKDGEKLNIHKEVVQEGINVVADFLETKQKGEDAFLKGILKFRSDPKAAITLMKKVMNDNSTIKVYNQYDESTKIPMHDLLNLYAQVKDSDTKEQLIDNGLHNKKTKNTFEFKSEEHLNDVINEAFKGSRSGYYYELVGNNVVKITRISNGKSKTATLTDGKWDLKIPVTSPINLKFAEQILARKAMADSLGEYFNSELRDNLNELSSRRLGYAFADVENYHPRKSTFSKDAIEKLPIGANGTMEALVSNFTAGTKDSFLESRKSNVKSPIIQENFFQSSLHHIDATAKFLTMYEWYTDNKNALQGVEIQYEKANMEHIYDSLTKTLDYTVGYKEKSDPFTVITNKLLHNQAVHALAFNPGTVAKQVVSIGTAMTEVPTKYHAQLIKGTITPPGTPAYKEINDGMSKIAVFRDRKNAIRSDLIAGSGFGKTISRDHARVGNWLIEKSIGFADWQVMQGIYTAAKAEGEANGKKGDSLIEYINHYSANVISKTQPDSSSFSKTGLQRSRSPIARTFSVFSSQVVKNHQMKLKGIHDLLNGRPLEGLQKLLAVLLFNGTMMGVIDHIRAEYLSKKKYRKEWEEDLVDAGFSALVGSEPLVGDLFTAIYSGSMDRNTFTKEAIALETWHDILKSAELMGSKKRKDRERGRKLLTKRSVSSTALPKIFIQAVKVAQGEYK